MAQAANVLSLRSNWQKRFAAAAQTASAPPLNNPEDAFFYTLDLLVDDFGKKHSAECCVLCNPMQIAGQHRDELMVQLGTVLFTSFFPSCQSYLAEVQGNLLESLMSRKSKQTYGSLKEKWQVLVAEQIRSDIRDFIEDLAKHLLKFRDVVVEENKKAEIVSACFDRLQEDWVQVI